jgi:hypothetical protein
MARLINQPLPDPPQAYDQEYFFRLINALNLFMLQSTGQAKQEDVAARFICTAPVVVDPAGKVPNSVPNTKGLPTGMIYFFPNPDQPTAGQPGEFYACIVTQKDQK